MTDSSDTGNPDGATSNQGGASGTAPQVVTTFEQLREYVGQELGVGKWHQVTQEQVNAFADVTGDHQYIHVDPERARQTPFKGTIAHGYLTLSLLPSLTRERDGVQLDLGARMTVNYGLNRVRFPSPVPVGNRIRVRSTLLAAEEVASGTEPAPGRTPMQLTWQHTIEVEGISKPALVAETLQRIYF